MGTEELGFVQLLPDEQLLRVVMGESYHGGRTLLISLSLPPPLQQFET